MKIRQTKKREYFETENLTREAFWNLYRPGCDEHLALHKLRKTGEGIKGLDCVLEEEGKIVAHIIYCPSVLQTAEGKKIDVITFGPVSVYPEYQKKGYGSAIIQKTLQKAKKAGYGAVLITGNPDYYKRFGFLTCSEIGVYLPGFDRSDPAPFFMYLELKENYLPRTPSVLFFPASYETEKKELEEFEKQFPHKVKEKRPGKSLMDCKPSKSKITW